MYISNGEEEVIDYKGNVASQEGLLNRMTALLFMEPVTFLIVSPSGMILEEVSACTWLSFMPFSSNVQLIHGGQMTTNRLLSSADERVCPRKRQSPGMYSSRGS